MANRSLIVRLQGGLGNQMFQYAAARALSLRNRMDLSIDNRSGFIRDKVYNRNFQLGPFAIEARKATFMGQIPFWLEEKLHRSMPICRKTFSQRPWGDFVYETKVQLLNELINCRLYRNTWMEGYWQSEKYFSDYRDIIRKELTPPKPIGITFVEAAKRIESSESVAVGVRLFEDVPGGGRGAPGGLTPLSFYMRAANLMAERLTNPIFFVFCSDMSIKKEKLNLPGQVYYLTGDNGFIDPVQTLALISRCKHHIISNSSFYWWGAWLAESHNPDVVVVASNLFPNPDTVPNRWRSLGN